MAVRHRTPIKVVPHFMRLQEWIALEEGYYQDEGLEPELLTGVMHQVSMHGGDPYLRRPQDRAFLESAEVANSACHWGSVCNAGAGIGKFVPDIYGVARFAICVRPDSKIQRLTDLRGVPVGVGIMAGSHFTALTALEQALPKEHICVANIGGPGRRLLALLDREVEAVTLLDPEIPIAESKGLRKLAHGEFRTLFWVSPNLSHELLTGYFRALRRADEALRQTPEKYMPLWERNVPPELKGIHDYRNFGLGELLFFERYTEADFRAALEFAAKWGLTQNIRENRYEELVAPVTV